MISITFRLKGKVNSNIEMKCRDRKNYSEEEFKRKLSLTDWENVFKADNVNAANYEFDNKFASLLESVAPMTKIQARNKISEWISTETKLLMEQRDRARDTAAISTLQEDWSRYKTLRNICNKRIKSDRKKKTI